ncbi:hypothetical protein AV530_010127 [Patagioenas fasciata monilis]|uniref:Uncharacterized protein n=1 Tax=Patagioenas fasciata monilis TaxID=372326 RepID=A0A1V4L0S9_PATFA|nr:hypothetical protein AV530_010127 [Patagioenas fasciata monilis]
MLPRLFRLQKINQPAWAMVCCRRSTDARKCRNTSSDAMDDGLGTRASREGEKEGKNENWKLKTSSDINKCKKGFKDLLFPECYSE